MGGKDSSAFGPSRVNRDRPSVVQATSRSSTSTPLHRQFLPAQLSSLSSNDPIPSLDDLSVLSKYLAAVRIESSARLIRLEGRTTDPLRPIFSGNTHDLFAPPGLTTSAISAASLYDSSSRASSSTTRQKTKERASNLTSPDPSGSNQLLNASPSSASGAQKQKIKIKREREADGTISVSATSNLYTDPKKEIKLGGRGKAGRGQSMDVDDESIASIESDWDLDEDSLPSRPGRTYACNRKRKRKDSGIDSMEDESGSEFESAAGGANRASVPAKNGISSTTAAAGRSGALGSTLRRGSEAGVGAAAASSAVTPKSTGFGMRLKLNPIGSSATKAAGTPLSGVGSPALQCKTSEVTNISTRRNSIMPSASPHPSTPLAHSFAPPPAPVGPALGWELPARTPQTFMPALQPSRLPRSYPTHPSQVNENFADKDWKERERERDRLLERESVQPGTPAPGQALVKETAAARRGGRDQQQTPINTFYNYADAFFKTLTEDDLAWLSSKSDDNEPFQMPALGRHYTEIWAEEDALAASAMELYGTPFSGGASIHSRTPSMSVGAGALPMDPAFVNDNTKRGAVSGHDELDIPPPSHFKAKDMTDRHLGLSEAAMNARNGPLAERLVSALLPKVAERSSSFDENGIKLDEPNGLCDHTPSYGEEEGGSEYAEGEPDLDFDHFLHDHDTLSFEERIEKELKAIEVLGPEEKVDWSHRADDEISTTLRTVQRALARQQKINALRKGRLFDIAMDRMAYQDYINCFNSIEKDIENGWTKRLRQIRASLTKRKKDDGQSNGLASTNGTPQPVNMGPVRPQPSDALVAALERRGLLQEAFREMFETSKFAYETPSESVYADLGLERIE